MFDDDTSETTAVEDRTRRHFHQLSWKKSFAFGIGHFYNDLCASMWFTYLLLFFKKVRKLNAAHAGLLMLIGQVVDGISTPLIGIAIDRNLLPQRLINYFGPRNSWHLIGTILVSCSFPLIFNRCFLCSSDDIFHPQNNKDIYLVLYYVPFIAVFQIGWACVQISHLALIPLLGSNESLRATLNSIRYAFTVLANMLIYIMLFLFLYIDSATDSEKQVNPTNFLDFRDTSLIASAIGITFTTIYHFATEDPVRSERRRMMSTSSMVRSSEHTIALQVHRWQQWLVVPHFYIIACVYMFVRLYGNISQAFYPFYVQQVQHMHKIYVSILPMVIYLVSFLVSNATSSACVSENISRKVFFNIGVFIGLIACTFMLLLNSDYCLPLSEGSKPSVMILLSVCMGAANSLCTVSALSFVADLIHDNITTGAFVYGLMSFVEKVANGVAYQIIELFNPECYSSSTKEECERFYRNVQAIVAGVSLLLAFITFIPLCRRSIAHRHEILFDSDDSIDNGEVERSITVSHIPDDITEDDSFIYA